METKKILIGMTVVCLIVSNSTYGFADFPSTTTDQQYASTTSATTSTTSGSTSTSSTSTSGSTTQSFLLPGSPLSMAQLYSSTGPTDEDYEKQKVYDTVLRYHQGEWPIDYKPPVIMKISSTSDPNHPNIANIQWKVVFESKSRIYPDGTIYGSGPPKYGSTFLVNQRTYDYGGTWKFRVIEEKTYLENRLVGVSGYDFEGGHPDNAHGSLKRTEGRIYDSNGRLTKKVVDVFLRYEGSGGDVWKEHTETNYINGKLYSKVFTVYNIVVPIKEITTYYGKGVRLIRNTVYFKADSLATSGLAIKEDYVQYRSDGKAVSHKQTIVYSTEVMQDPDGRKYQAAIRSESRFYNEQGEMVQYHKTTFNPDGHPKSFTISWYDGNVKIRSLSDTFSADGKKRLRRTERQFHAGTAVTEILNIWNYATQKHTHRKYDANGLQVGATYSETIEGPVDATCLRSKRTVS